MPQAKPKFRKREIAFALAMGALGTGGALAVLSEMHQEERPAISQVESTQGSQLGDFDEVVVVGAQNVIISTGKEPAVRSEGSAEAIAELEAVVEDGRLEIRPRKSFGGDLSRFEDVTFYVTVPMVREVTLSGSGDVKVDRVEGDRFEATVAGTGELAIGSMYVQDVDFSIAGRGSITASGDANDVKVAIGGSGDIHAGALDTATANITVAGSGDVALSAQNRARVAILGSGDVAIAGPASCSVSKLGSGEVTCNEKEIAD